MDKFFNPKKIAIIGASRSKEKLGYQLLNNLAKSGYKGEIFPINPEADEILGFKVYKNITDVPEEIDLAVVIVPAKIVLEVLKGCVKKKVPYAIIISAGFSEIGPKGKVLQEEIKEEILKVSPIRIMGPNCLGLINTSLNLNATFAAPALVPGDVGAILQSGALGAAALDWAKEFNFGFSKFVSLGNKIDIEESELIEYLAQDKETKVIALYLEQVANPRRFFDIARKTSYEKPIVVLKGGQTSLGAKAAFSHTAAMVTSKKINYAIFNQGNLLVAKTIEDMLNIIKILSSEPRTKNDKLAIITNAGGPGILATDMAASVGLNVPSPSAELQKKLKGKIEVNTSLGNPFDLTGEAKAIDYENVIEGVLASKEYSALSVILTPQTTTEVEETAKVLASKSKAGVPIVASFLGGDLIKEGVKILRDAKVPYFDDPENAVEALGRVSRYWRKRSYPKDFIELSPYRQILNPCGEALELVSRYNIPIPPSGMATNIDVAMKIVGRIGFPVAVKNISRKYVHKFKAGKVVLNVQSESYLKEVIKKIGFPVLIQRMVDFPFEVIVGAKRDNNLGVLVSFGWGGIFTEDLGDVALRILPLTEYDLEEMIKETKIGKILIREQVNLSFLKNILIEVCQIMTDFPEITELDLNPIKVDHNNVYCVDARYK